MRGARLESRPPRSRLPSLPRSSWDGSDMSELRTDGIADARPGREATTGANLLVDREVQRGGAARRGRKREELMVPPAEFTSYYGKPVLNEPTWEARDIAGYLFLGGLAAGSSLVGAGAQLTGRR